MVKYVPRWDISVNSNNYFALFAAHCFTKLIILYVFTKSGNKFCTAMWNPIMMVYVLQSSALVLDWKLRPAKCAKVLDFWLLFQLLKLAVVDFASVRVL